MIIMMMMMMTLRKKSERKSLEEEKTDSNSQKNEPNKKKLSIKKKIKMFIYTKKKYKRAYIWIRQAHYKVRGKIIDPSEKWIAYKHKLAKKSRSYNYFLFLSFIFRQ